MMLGRRYCRDLCVLRQRVVPQRNDGELNSHPEAVDRLQLRLRRSAPAARPVHGRVRRLLLPGATRRAALRLRRPPADLAALSSVFVTADGAAAGCDVPDMHLRDHRQARTVLAPGRGRCDLRRL